MTKGHGPEEFMLKSSHLAAEMALNLRDARQTVRLGIVRKSLSLLAILCIVSAGVAGAKNKAITFGKPRLMRDDWRGVFDREEIAESIRRIT